MQPNHRHDDGVDQSFASWFAAMIDELRPRNQLLSHPAAALLWLLAVGSGVSVPTLWLLNRPEWVADLAVSGGLWLNVILGAWCSIRFRRWNWQPMDDDGSVQAGSSDSASLHEEQSIRSTNRLHGAENRFRSDTRSFSQPNRGTQQESVTSRFDSHSSVN